MLIRGGKGRDMHELHLDQLELAVKLVPNGKCMRYETESSWLVEQRDQMMQWKARGYQGFDYDSSPPQWKRIMEDLEGFSMEQRE
jgi:hypothetical protein